jgi:two-component system OmpR family response regulator
MKVLLIEDDRKTASFVTKGLKESGFAVDVCADGEEGRTQALHGDYDAIVLDLMLPSVDGLTVLRSLRAANRTTPVLILSAKGTLDDKVAGLRQGGDDYLTKPFAFTELLWRLQALVRRAGIKPRETELQVHDLNLNVLTRRVSRGRRTMDLQPREFALLEFLMRNAGRVVTRTMILEHVWNCSFDPETNVVESRMSRLRAKVDAGGEPPLIHTYRGVGYALRPPA